MKSIRSLLGLAVAVLVLAQSQVQAASDIFIRFTGASAGSGLNYTGDSKNAQFLGNQGWFEANSVEFGMENVITIGSATGGVGVGKAKANPLSCVKMPNSASAALFTACATGGHWDVMEIVFTKLSPNGKTEAYLRVELKLVFVSELAMEMAGGDDNPSETVTVAYGAQRLTFFGPPASGVGTPVQTGQSIWSFVKNNKTFDA
ncbi:type VI secretion system tube protein Hcp [Luteolibacter sp. Populi]|uniref:type VI secretion system tube protein Hcp n=1 Tax=Luteolibacter sp. Populi TaxID=3230487 RepID=UPI0034652A7F